MALFDFFSKTIKNVVKEDVGFSPTFIPLDFINSLNNGGFGGEVSKQQALLYFLSVPELYMIIAKKAQMFSNGSFKVVSKQTGKEQPLTNPIAKLMSRPNWHQGAKEFLIQTKTFREIYENEYLMFNYPLGFSPSQSKQINSLNPLKLSLPASLTTRLETPLFMMNEKPLFNYKYKENNKEYSINSTDVLQINNPVVDGGLVGSGRLQALKQPLDNIKGAYESRGSLIFSRGALGILSNASKDGIGQAAPLRDGDKETLQNEYKKYGLTKGQWQLLITNMNLNYQRIAMNPKELMLFEEIEDDFNKLIGAFGLRREIFPNIKGGTFTNQKEATKAAYVDSVIPEAQEWVSALNTFLGLDKKSYHITVDYTHLPVFAEDLKEKGIALRNYIAALDIAFNSGGLTLQQYKDELAKILS